MSVITLKCPNCGGELVFEPSTQQYRCPYCFSTFTQQQIDALTGDENAPHPQAEENTASGWEAASEDDYAQEGGSGDAALYSCPSCGAQIVTDPTTAATFCYYCHNPVVLQGRLSGEYLPDRIIPFQITREQAKEKFEKFFNSKKFIPKAFYNEEQMEKLSGVYYPYWCYGNEMDGSVYAKGNKVRVWRSGQTEYTETSVFNIRRSGTVQTSNMLHNALRASDKSLVENVQPYDMSGVRRFSMGYLSGFLAEKRDMEKGEFSQEFLSTSQENAKKLMRDTISGYASVNIQDSSFRVNREDWGYVLLPVWVLTYRSGQETYYYAMNGQTGNVCGKLPVDKGRLAAVAGVVGLIIMALCMAGGYFLV